jgi:DNA replication protein DnaC
VKEALRNGLKELRLSGLAGVVEVRAQEAAAGGLTALEFLELCVQDELLVRRSRMINRRTKAAGFREVKRLEDFDWQFNVGIKRSDLFRLATCQFVRDTKDVLFVGPPGVGKSHLAQALGQTAVKAGHLVLYRSIFDLVQDFVRDEAFSGAEKTVAKYVKPELLIIDDMGLKQLPKRSGEYLFEVIMRRYEQRSTLMTSNRPLEEWGKLLQDVPTATAILDRFLHHAEVVTMKGRSYRLKHHAVGGDGAKE